MENNILTIEKPYVITYTNLIEFEGKKFSFRKKELFYLAFSPTHIPRSEQGWWIGRKLLTVNKAKELIRNINFDVDVSDIQWTEQEKLNHVFNLCKKTNQ